MGLELQSFRTRVARRVFFLFIVCAIVPITALAALSYYQVTRHQETLQYERLSRECKAILVSIYERLLFLDSEMVLISASAKNRGGGEEGVLQRIMAQIPDKDRFETIQIKPGRIAGPPDANGCRLKVQTVGSKPTGILMSKNLEVADARLVGRVNPDYLWKAGVRLPVGIEFCILGVDGTRLHCSEPGFAQPVLAHLDRAQWPHKGTMEWEMNDHTYRAAYTNLFLEPNFKTSGWAVVVVEPTAGVSALEKDFVWTFPALVIFSLGLVFMLGQYLIRRNMGPIEVLQNATGRIAEGEFGHNVDIDSGDEFEDLGSAFNAMSRRLEEGQKLLVRTARMGTMGQMASGFVHEVRQPLSAMMGHVQLVMLKDRDPDTLESMETVLGAIENLDRIISRFRTFSQETPMEKVTLNLNDVIQEVYRLLSIRFRKRAIECRLELHDGYVKVWGDYRSLQQVLSNLMINALDELEEKEDGQPVLAIQTQAADDHATLTVIDNGRGIPEDIHEKMFDPFFTTKSADKGTGLGMAIVESIVHQHDANMELESAVGAGTTIRIVFPSTPQGENA